MLGFESLMLENDAIIAKTLLQTSWQRQGTGGRSWRHLVKIACYEQPRVRPNCRFWLNSGSRDSFHLPGSNVPLGTRMNELELIFQIGSSTNNVSTLSNNKIQKSKDLKEGPTNKGATAIEGIWELSRQSRIWTQVGKRRIDPRQCKSNKRACQSFIVTSCCFVFRRMKFQISRWDWSSSFCQETWF